MIESPTTPNVDFTQIDQLRYANHPDPFSFLGLHSAPEGESGYLVRAYQPAASSLRVTSAHDESVSVEAEKVHPDGFFVARFPETTDRFDYRLTWTYNDGNTSGPVADAFSFGPVIEDGDLYYFGEGTHRGLWNILGANLRTIGGTSGVHFAVWAPNAKRVSVVGDFNGWDGRLHPMRNRGGVWEIFVPQIGTGCHYKFEIVGQNGRLFNKSDPMAFFSQHGQSTASITYDLDTYEWNDGDWMENRPKADPYHGAMSIYEVHLGSWARETEEGNRFLTYTELADRLINHAKALGFTHLELMPVAEFPFDGSWGYQVCGYFSPTSRFGSPDEFRYFVDRCHQEGIGVIVDWVPAHFPKDAHGLGRFDGSALYEHADPRQGEHTDWGTYIFNYGRNEVRNFLIANALFWLKEYHIDGLRVDAVASMLYLDYSRKSGQWVPNQFGGRENLEAIHFIKEANRACYEENPGIIMFAEESTDFGGVSKPIDHGGLGYGFKWNMGWMNDFLEYMKLEPIFRKYHHGDATFSMVYQYSENFVLVLSHDEVVHGKKSLLSKMPGDVWQKFANLRFFLGWMFAHPGKKLLFQGTEIAQWDEWKHGHSLDWHLLQHQSHRGVFDLISDLNALYRSEPALHELDHEPGGFEWIDHDNSDDSVFSFIRRSRSGEEIVCVVNATPVPRQNYKFGVPNPGFYKEIFNSDAERYAGSNMGSYGGAGSISDGWQGRPHSITITVPPLATVFFKRT